MTSTTIETRTTPYHAMGIQFPEGATLAEGFDLAHLAGWNLTPQPMFVTVGEGDALRMQEIPNRVAIVRDSPFNAGEFDTIGANLSLDYSLIHNEQALEFATTVVDVASGDVRADAGGAWRGGSSVFLNLDLGEALIGGADPFKTYLFVSWTHDGTGALTLALHHQRMYCTNQIRGILGQGTAPVYKVRHVGTTTEGRVAQAREALAIAAEGQSEFERVANQWAQTEITNRQFDSIVNALLAEPTEGMAPAAVTRREEQRGTFRSLFTGPTNANLGQTAWAALNAWTEMGDWYTTGYRTDAARAVAQITSETMDSRRRQGVRAIAAIAGITA